MAGSEQTGYENATDHLVENAYYVLTPTPQSSPADLKKLTALVLDLHAVSYTHLSPSPAGCS